MKKHLLRNSIILAALLGAGLAALLTSCATPKSGPPGPPTLKDTYKRHFYVGVAINRATAEGSAVRSDNANRTPEQLEKDIALVKAQFNQISPENDLKWQLTQPYEGPNGYDFGPADAYVNFGVSNHMYIVGHTLVWHSQTPGWVFGASNAPPPPGWTRARPRREADGADLAAGLAAAGAGAGAGRRRRASNCCRGCMTTSARWLAVTRARSRCGTW